MSHTEMAPAQTPEGQALDFKLEVVVLPVTDVDRADALKSLRSEIAAARERIGVRQKS